MTCATSTFLDSRWRPNRHQPMLFARLHRRHVERVPYETLWIHGGETWTIDPHEAAVRIALQRRGGYCYHLNGAFALLLATLGYHVKHHAGGVYGPTGPTANQAGNHLVLTVNGLATDDSPAGEWYVDVGLGDALHEPIPLTPASVQQGPFQLELARVADPTIGDWRLRHDPAGAFVGMVWRTGDADRSVLDAHHRVLSTSPESGFVKVGLAQTRDAAGVDVMSGLIVKRVESEPRTDEPITDRAAWFGVLNDLFDFTFEASAPGTTDRLWARTLANHQTWLASQS